MYREFTAPDIVLNTLNALSQLILRTTNTPTDLNCFPLASMKCIVLCGGEQVSLTAKGYVFIYREEGINTKALTDDFFFFFSPNKAKRTVSLTICRVCLGQPAMSVLVSPKRTKTVTRLESPVQPCGWIPLGPLS